MRGQNTRRRAYDSSRRNQGGLLPFGKRLVLLELLNGFIVILLTFLDGIQPLTLRAAPLHMHDLDAGHTLGHAGNVGLDVREHGQDLTLEIDLTHEHASA